MANIFMVDVGLKLPYRKRYILSESNIILVKNTVSLWLSLIWTVPRDNTSSLAFIRSNPSKSSLFAMRTEIELNAEFLQREI